MKYDLILLFLGAFFMSLPEPECYYAFGTYVAVYGIIYVSSKIRELKDKEQQNLENKKKLPQVNGEVISLPDGMMLLYDEQTKTFLSQGRTVHELINAFYDRFPKRNIMIHALDEPSKKKFTRSVTPNHE